MPCRKPFIFATSRFGHGAMPLDDLSRAKNSFCLDDPQYSTRSGCQRSNSTVSLGITAFWPRHGIGTCMGVHSHGTARGIGCRAFGPGRSGGKYADCQGNKTLATLVRGGTDRQQCLSVRSAFRHAHPGQGRHWARCPRPARTQARHIGGGHQPTTSLLKRLDIDSEKTYPVKQADLQNLVALVEASPTSSFISNETDRVAFSRQAKDGPDNFGDVLRRIDGNPCPASARHNFG